jgi:hypothetical protein
MGLSFCTNGVYACFLCVSGGTTAHEDLLVNRWLRIVWVPRLVKSQANCVVFWEVGGGPNVGNLLQYRLEAATSEGIIGF